MKSKHTPGPWKVNPNNYQEILADGRTKDNTLVATVPVGLPDSSLIASAPDLLLALERIEVMLLAKRDAESDFLLTLIQPAMRKARGEK